MEQAAREQLAALMKARASYLAAQEQTAQARQTYIAAEKSYLGTGTEPVPNVLVDGVLVMPHDDWYDMKDGERLQFHTVEVVS